MPKQKGVTLIELLVTITIIAILAAVGTINYTKFQKNARISKRLQDLQAIHTAVELYKTTKGHYPVAQNAFRCIDGLTGDDSLAPDFMPKVPEDPYSGACYLYQSDSTGIEYKLRTDDPPKLPRAEMDKTDFNQQKALVDPKRDGGSADDCKIESDPAFIPSAWAYYTSGACGY